jgi:predicted SAM-dependent methyltransferase
LQTKDFSKSKYAKKASYDTILLAHVFEHLKRKDNIELLKEYMPFLKKNGQLLIICPQEKGYTTDQTHVEFYDFHKIEKLLSEFGFVTVRKMSFPVP